MREEEKFLFTEIDWDFEALQRVYDAIEEIALNDLGLDVYPNQIEVISSEQMLDAYCSIGMPLMYRHWSFGKRFIRESELYKKGYQGLAYEIVINSNPCLVYLMEDNTMALQALVIAHAAFGHNHFFKNNHLFKQWTDAGGILDYLSFAKKYIAHCEEKYGETAVVETLDAAHALMDQGVFRHKRRFQINWGKEMQDRESRRHEYEREDYNPLWSTLPKSAQPRKLSDEEKRLKKRKDRLQLPEENILYFLEKYSPILEGWQREVLRIVRNIAQYFYPQRQTKIMNEGCATFVHYYIMHTLREKGLISAGAMLEILHSHTQVVLQRDAENRAYGGINPYALGFEMMRDIYRICTGVDLVTKERYSSEQRREDKEWFPAIVGKGNWQEVLKDAWANYRDESFIRQFLSPHLIRKFHLFALTDNAEESVYVVKEIHDEKGYRKIRNFLAEMYDIGTQEPNIQITDVDLLGDRHLRLVHTMHNNIPLREESRNMTLGYLKRLWGYDVTLVGIKHEAGESKSKEMYKISTAQDEEEDNGD